MSLSVGRAQQSSTSAHVVSPMVTHVAAPAGSMARRPMMAPFTSQADDGGCWLGHLDASLPGLALPLCHYSVVWPELDPERVELEASMLSGLGLEMTESLWPHAIDQGKSQGQPRCSGRVSRPCLLMGESHAHSEM